MTIKTAQLIRDAADQLTNTTLPVSLIATNLRALAEAVDTLQREHTQLRSASSAVALAISNLGESSRVMLHAAEQRQSRATDSTGTASGC